jgi:hypothetical protein
LLPSFQDEQADHVDDKQGDADAVKDFEAALIDLH